MDIKTVSFLALCGFIVTQSVLADDAPRTVYGAGSVTLGAASAGVNNCGLRQYTVSYDCGDGTGTIADDVAIYNTDFTPNDGTACTAPEGNAVYFSGWRVSGTDTVFNISNKTASGIAPATFRYMYADNITLVAQWESITVLSIPSDSVAINGMGYRVDDSTFYVLFPYGMAGFVGKCFAQKPSPAAVPGVEFAFKPRATIGGGGKIVPDAGQKCWCSSGKTPSGQGGLQRITSYFYYADEFESYDACMAGCATACAELMMWDSNFRAKYVY